MTTQNEEARAKDRELLELAAKAAGMHAVYEFTFLDGETSSGPCTGGLWNREQGGYWNPLTDDGDALRVAAKLKMFDEMAQFQWNLSVMQEKFSDPAEAIRRAIVETAMEIERVKP